MMLVKIFLSFLKIGGLALGGAYSFLPLIEREVVDKYHWLAREEFLDVLGMSKVFPGAISIKFATYTGYKIAGVPGVIMANMGTVIAPILLIILAAGLYNKYKDIPRVKSALLGVQLAVFSLILAAAFQLIDLKLLMQVRSFIIVGLCFSLFMWTKVHPALIIISAGIVGVLVKF